MCRYYLRDGELTPAYTTQYSGEITIGEDEYNTKYNDVYLSTAAQLGRQIKLSRADT